MKAGNREQGMENSGEGNAIPQTLNPQHSSLNPLRIAVLVSGQGRGSNMQAIVDACKSGKINGEVALVIGVKDDAPAMDRARTAGISTAALSPKSFRSGEAYDESILAALREHQIDLICLAGYMRVLGQQIIDAYRDRIMNVHPALIPSFCGKGMYGHHVHEAVIARGVKYTGVTVHLVDEEYDTGPIVAQTVVPVEQDDTPDTLAARVLAAEHATYTDAIALFAQGRLRVVSRKVTTLPATSVIHEELV
jgi:phosphoribosylglycinamide formyltransferase-1